MFTTSILKVGKIEKHYLQKHSYIFKYLKSTFQITKMKGPIQVLANASENIIISISLLKPMLTILKRKCTQKN
jgi:hypothetical protein